MSKRGFTLIELSISLGIISLLVTGTFFVTSFGMDSARQTETIENLTTLKRAIVGDPKIVSKESRTDFGYVGDMGSLPASLENLWFKGSQPAFVFDDANKTGAGWAGPYIQPVAMEFTNDIAVDAWGNPIQYVVQNGTSSVTGQQYVARISSNGIDGTPNTADDIIVEIYSTEARSTVTGYIRDDSGNPIPGLTVQTNYPSNGVLQTSALATTDSTGAYTFTNIPMGNRSVTVLPRLTYNDGSAVTTGKDWNDVQFNMLSFTCGAVTGFIADYDPVVAYYQTLKIASSTVFNNNKAPAGSNQRLNFSPVDISQNGCAGGNAAISLIYPIRVQTPFTLLEDQTLQGAAGSASNVQLQMKNFTDSPDGNGGPVDMTGVSMTVTFFLADGTVAGTATFTPVHK